MMTSFYNLLKYAQTGIASPDMTYYDKLRASTLMGGVVQTLTGQPPLSFKANGKPLISWSMKGNAQQTGTPAPDNPVMPEFVGERTGNLANLYGVDKTFLGLHCTVSENMSVVINGTKTSGANIRTLVNPNIMLLAGTYTVKVKMVSGSITNVTDGGLFFGINESTYSLRTSPGVKQVGDTGKRTFTLSEDTLLSSIDIAASYESIGSVWDNATFQCWFYSGSDDKEYEPYGYKIPITNASVTTPLYLGEVSTTRRVWKLVLDGTENWNEGSSNYYIFINVSGRGEGIPNSTALCTHTENGAVVNKNGTALFFEKSVFVHTSAADFKAYLAAQYAAGTPVTVWYVLATEQTGIVNEPLMRIGDYADELHSTDAAVTIPTAKGQNTLTVEGDLPPSEMTITYFEEV